ncbi:3D domain-containing protein [Cohnella sp.]|uniref:3D domain-containing protein n=1 Tax=Cohnella sp. TaxID=1883426 RepID=UPI00356A22B6
MKNSWKKLGMRSAAIVLGASFLLPGITAHAATSMIAKDTDTFWKISKDRNIPLKQLMKFNPKVDPLNIYAGLKIVIPSGTGGTSNKKTNSLKSAAATFPAIPAQSQSITAANGQTLSFSKVIDSKATAYSASAEENGKWGAVDYFGNPLKLGTIAVDPEVIPFGTKVYVTGYDFDGLPTGGFVAKATDTGGAIKGSRIDIFVPGSRSFVSQFGFQSVKVYVLK